MEEQAKRLQEDLQANARLGRQLVQLATAGGDESQRLVQIRALLTEQEAVNVRLDGWLADLLS